MYDAGVAISGLSCFMTPDLARDLANDIMTLVSILLYQWYIISDKGLVEEHTSYISETM